jgi:hypothetical protein
MPLLKEVLPSFLSVTKVQESRPSLFVMPAEQGCGAGGRARITPRERYAFDS